MMWDEGTWEPKGDPRAGLKKGHLSFILHGERLKGGWDLIRMRGDGKRENWLLIKENDAEARKNGANDEISRTILLQASRPAVPWMRSPAERPGIQGHSKTKPANGQQDEEGPAIRQRAEAADGTVSRRAARHPRR